MRAATFRKNGRVKLFRFCIVNSIENRYKVKKWDSGRGKMIENDRPSQAKYYVNNGYYIGVQRRLKEVMTQIASARIEE